LLKLSLFGIDKVRHQLCSCSASNNILDGYPQVAVFPPLTLYFIPENHMAIVCLISNAVSGRSIALSTEGLGQSRSDVMADVTAFALRVS
jgi:hypothetical protein